MDNRIFRHTIRGQEIAADPQEALRAIMTYPGVNFLTDAKLIDLRAVPPPPDGAGEDMVTQFDAMQRQAQEALSRMIAAARQAFDMAPWAKNDEDGFTQEEVWEVVSAFFTWLETVKKNMQSTQTLQKVTVSRGN